MRKTSADRMRDEIRKLQDRISKMNDKHLEKIRPMVEELERLMSAVRILEGKDDGDLKPETTTEA